VYEREGLAIAVQVWRGDLRHLARPLDAKRDEVGVDEQMPGGILWGPKGHGSVDARVGCVAVAVSKVI
jgi:hypothetical protein